MAFHGVGNTLKPLALSRAYLPYDFMTMLHTAAFRVPDMASKIIHSPVPLRPVNGFPVLPGRSSLLRLPLALRHHRTRVP